MRFLFILFLPLVFSCKDDVIDSSVYDNEDVSFEVISNNEGWSTYDAEEKYFHIKSQEEMDSILGKHLNQVSSLPEVDFSKESILFVRRGAKPSTGYDIEIKKIATLDGKTTVEIQLTDPSCGSLQGAAMTNPWQMILVPNENISEFIEFKNYELGVNGEICDSLVCGFVAFKNSTITSQYPETIEGSVISIDTTKVDSYTIKDSKNPGEGDLHFKEASISICYGEIE